MSIPILTILLEKFRLGALSQEEKRQLAGLLDEPATRVLAAQLIEKELADPDLNLTGEEETMELIYRQIMADPQFSQQTGPPVRHIGPFRKTWRWIAAASLLLVFAAAAWFFTRMKAPAPALSQNERFKNDVVPGHNTAILTLSGGQTLLLDSAHEGRLAMQAGTLVIKSDSGSLAYRTDHAAAGRPQVFNTLTTPRGGQYHLTLADGTRVWLNAASSITYPTAFTTSDRQVSITGEAYFEIAKNKDQPFIVRKGGMAIQVLGTAFNVNAYDDESGIRTTLLEGSVKISTGQDQAILRPGQQAIAPGNPAALRIIGDVNTEDVLAWKNGQFLFHGAGLETVMRQVARWYDVDIVYRGSHPDYPFVGKIPRNVPLSELLKLLELTGEVHFAIDGKKLTVLP